MRLGRKLADAALANSKSLYRCASGCADEGHFGYATSLMVLAVEEAVKAVFSLFLSNNISLDPEIERSYLRRHQARLTFGQGAFFVLHVVQANFPDPTGNEDLAEVAAAVEENLRKIMAMSEEEIRQVKVSSGADWWLRANELKQRGLYVDFADELVQTPRQVTVGEYEKSKEMAEHVLTAARLSMLLFKRAPQYFIRLFDAIDVDALAANMEAEANNIASR